MWPQWVLSLAGGQARPWTAGGLPTCRTESQVEGALYIGRSEDRGVGFLRCPEPLPPLGKLIDKI